MVVRTGNLDMELAIIAYDRDAHCTRVMSGADCEFVDEYGLPVRGYLIVDTVRGEAFFHDRWTGKTTRRLGTYRIVVRESRAKALRSLGK